MNEWVDGWMDGWIKTGPYLSVVKPPHNIGNLRVGGEKNNFSFEPECREISDVTRVALAVLPF